MGGEGSMLHAIKSLAYNNSLRRKTNPFDKQWGTRAAWKHAYTKTATEQPHSCHYDKDTRARVRRKIRLERKRDWSGLVTVAVLVVLLTGLMVHALVQAQFEWTPPKYKPTNKAEAAKPAENAAQYQYFINAGDDWMKQNHWANAAFEYQKALEHFPRDYQAHVRLATIYTYSCKHEQKNCEAAEMLIQRLLSQKPESADLYLLRASLHLARGDEDAATRDFAKADELTP